MTDDELADADAAPWRAALAAKDAEIARLQGLLREAETLLKNTISVPDLRARIAAELEPKP